MKKSLVFISFLGLLSFSSIASPISEEGLPRLKFLQKLKHKEIKLLRNSNSENHKAHAVGMAVLLGPFGMHRIYLGTEAHVPVIYCITLGGGFGFLPITDIAAILLTPELEPYVENDRVIMWLK